MDYARLSWTTVGLPNALPFTGEALNGNVDNTPAPESP